MVNAKKTSSVEPVAKEGLMSLLINKLINSLIYELLVNCLIN